jgi:hypothetical protein
MVRRTRILIAVAAAGAAAIFSGAALAPAAGDPHTTGGRHVSYTKDGIPFVDSGFECKAGHAADKKDRRHAEPDASDY